MPSAGIRGFGLPACTGCGGRSSRSYYTVRLQLEHRPVRPPHELIRSVPVAPRSRPCRCRVPRRRHHLRGAPGRVQSDAGYVAARRVSDQRHRVRGAHRLRTRSAAELARHNRVTRVVGGRSGGLRCCGRGQCSCTGRRTPPTLLMTHSGHTAHEQPHHSPAHQSVATAPSHGTHGTPTGRHAGHSVALFARRFWISLALTVPIVLLSPMIQHWLGLGERLRFPGDQYIVFALASAVYFYGGWPFLTGLVGELKRKQPGMMTLVAMAISTAYVYSTLVVVGLSGQGFFWELATLVDIMLLGHWVEMRSVMGASGALEALVRLLPAEAHRRRADGTVEDVPVSTLTRGDRVIVKPGERIPTDGVVVEGRTTVNQALLTGESQPVERGEGDAVIGGAVNGEAAIVLVVERTGSETYLAQVIDVVRQAQESRSRTQDLADRAAFWL